MGGRAAEPMHRCPGSHWSSVPRHPPRLRFNQNNQRRAKTAISPHLRQQLLGIHARVPGVDVLDVTRQRGLQAQPGKGGTRGALGWLAPAQRRGLRADAARCLRRCIAAALLSGRCSQLGQGTLQGCKEGHTYQQVALKART